MDNFFKNQLQPNAAEKPAASYSGQPMQDSHAEDPDADPADDNPYRSPMAVERVVEKRVKHVGMYNSIGGWLILPAIGLIISPLFGVLSIFRDLEVLEKIPQTMTSLRLFIYLECLAILILISCSLWAAVLFFTRKSSAPRAMIILYSLNILFAIAELIVVLSIASSNSEIVGQTIAQLLRAVIFGSIWIAYFCKSERVEETFVW